MRTHTTTTEALEALAWDRRLPIEIHDGQGHVTVDGITWTAPVRSQLTQTDIDNEMRAETIAEDRANPWHGWTSRDLDTHADGAAADDYHNRGER